MLESAESFLQKKVRAFVNARESDGTVLSENGFKSFFRNGFWEAQTVAEGNR